MSQEKKSTTKKKNTGQFKKGNTVGADTRFQKDNEAANKYKTEYCNLLIEFFNKPCTRIEYKETYYKGEISSRTPILLPSEYPTFELFAAKLGVTTTTLLNWCDKYPRFKDSYARAKEIQFGMLTSNAVTGLYNPVYAKFEAVNNHKQKDKTEVESKLIGLSEEEKALINNVKERLANGKK